MKIVVYGTGCKTCKLLHKRVVSIVEENNIEAKVIYETTMSNILEKGILQTPALEVNNKVIHTGKVPKVKDLQNLILKEIN